MSQPTQTADPTCASDAPPPADAVSLPNYDLHNHTIHCGHADGSATVANLVARAAQLGLTYFGISEHVMQPADVAHVDRIREELRSVSAPGVQLLLGVEMDVDSVDPGGAWVVPEINCDYVILSPHAFPEFTLDAPESDAGDAAEAQNKEIAVAWLEWYRKAIERGRCAILGHPLREPIAMDVLDLSDPEILEMSVDTLAPAIDAGIAFELNNSFLAALSTSVHRAGYLELLQRLHRLGMTFSRGSDSHDLTRVGACDGIERFARTLGLTASDWLDPATIRSPLD